MPAPDFSGGAASKPGTTDLLSLGGGTPAAGGGGPDQVSSQLQQIMGSIRDLGSTVSQIGSQLPALQPEVQQIQQIIRRMIIKAGQAAPKSTESADALPF